MKVIVLLSIFIGFSSKAYSQKEELKRFYKCFGIMVRDVPESYTEGRNLLSQIKSGKITGTQACMMIFDRATLNDEGEVLKLSSSNSSVDTGPRGYSIVGKSVLKTFNDFHRTWFNSIDFSRSVATFELATPEVMDAGDNAFYLTRALFTQQAFSSIVTSDEPLVAIRKSNRSDPRAGRHLKNRNRGFKIVKGYYIDKNLPDNEKFDAYYPPLIPMGEFVGIKKKPSYTVEDVFRYEKSYKRALPPGKKDIELSAHFGGGIVGSQTYFLLNNGMPQHSFTDGGISLHRRWSKELISDLLCRDLPVIRTTDAIKYVDTSGKSELPFRSGISCMQCHATMDPLTRVNRGMVYARSAQGGSLSQGARFSFVHNYPADLPRNHHDDTWPDEKDLNYYRRPHEGKLYYRTIEGELIEQNFEGHSELGRLLAGEINSQMNDLYYCAAKRYLNLFTGLEISFFDPGDINAPKLNSKDKELLSSIKKLGNHLKTHQSQRELIKEIIGSELFLKED